MLKKVLDSIERLSVIVESSIESGEFSQIDKDLLKSKVRDIYEDILFIDCYDKEDDNTFYFDPAEDHFYEAPAEEELAGKLDKLTEMVTAFQNEDESITVEITQEEQEQEIQEPSIASFESEDESITVEISQDEDDIEDETLETNIASFESEDESITIEISQNDLHEEIEEDIIPEEVIEDEEITEEEDIAKEEDIIIEELQIEQPQEDELESYDEIYKDYSPATFLEEDKEQPLIVEADQAEVVVYEAPLEYSLSDLITPSDRGRIITSLFGGNPSKLDAMILKVDAAEDFDSAIIVLQDSDIDHSSEDMHILVDALEKRFI